MTWSAVDLLEYATAGPQAVDVVGDRWVISFGSGSGAHTNGTYAILDVASGTARSFSGLSTGFRQAQTAVSLGRVFTVSGAANNLLLESVDPSGMNHSHGFGIGARGSMVGGPTWVASAADDVLRLFDAAANAMAWTVTLPESGKPGAFGNRLFIASNTSFREVSLADGSIIATWPNTTGVAPLGGLNGRAAVVGGRLHWPTSSAGISCLWLEPATGASGTVTSTPSGMPSISGSNQGWVAGPDGNLYALTGTAASAQMVVVDPNTGRWALRDFPTSRTGRYQLVSAGGKIINPWGGPR